MGSGGWLVTVEPGEARMALGTKVLHKGKGAVCTEAHVQSISWVHGLGAVSFAAAALAECCIPVVCSISTSSVHQAFRFLGQARGCWVLGDRSVELASDTSDWGTLAGVDTGGFGRQYGRVSAVLILYGGPGAGTYPRVAGRGVAFWGVVGCGRLCLDRQSIYTGAGFWYVNT